MIARQSAPDLLVIGRGSAAFAARVVVATGARPLRPELPGLEDLAGGAVRSNEEALEAKDVPEGGCAANQNTRPRPPT